MHRHLDFIANLMVLVSAALRPKTLQRFRWLKVVLRLHSKSQAEVNRAARLFRCTPASSVECLCPALQLARRNPEGVRRGMCGAVVQISMYINSPGGVVTAGMAVYDTMQVTIMPEASLLALPIQNICLRSLITLFQYAVLRKPGQRML